MPVAVVVDLPRPLERCWAALTNATLFAAWMPGLRRAVIVSSEPGGLPHEVLFEFSASLTYSLLYRYDLAKHEVRWDPRVGARDAVRGSARLEAHEGGTRLTYELSQGAGRATGNLVLGGAHSIVDAFVRWLGAQR